MAAIIEHKLNPPRELDEAPAPLKFERRASARYGAIGTLEAMSCDGEKPPSMIRLSLIDESAGGIAAMTQSPMAPGSRLRVRTCPVTGMWCDGVVIRCSPAGQGYRVALAFERRRAA